MATITVMTNLTLDGVYQGPGLPDEDTRDGFTQGGWAASYQAMTEAGDLFGDPGELLFGRWTYEQFFASWAPLVLGSGRSIGAGVESPGALDLVEVKSTAKGVILATYAKVPAPVGG